MSSKKPRIVDLPTDKAIRKLFPKAVIEQAKEAARKREKPKKVSK